MQPVCSCRGSSSTHEDDWLPVNMRENVVLCVCLMVHRRRRVPLSARVAVEASGATQPDSPGTYDPLPSVGRTIAECCDF